VWKGADRVFQAVQDRSFSPTVVPDRNPAAMPPDTIVPDIHTPYGFYERNYLNA
jgi:hypothetical protein